MTRTASARAKVFFGLRPDPSVRSALAGLSARAQAMTGGRSTPPPNLHLTLFFVGDVERSRIGVLEAAASTLRAAPFRIRVDRLGYWRHNRIVWAGPSEPPRALLELEAGLRTALHDCDIVGEERPFAPHVTLVRRAERKLLPMAFDVCGWDVSAFDLLESISAGGSVRYAPLKTWTLVPITG